MGVRVRQKQAGGPWWVFIKHHGRRASKCIGDKREAERIAKELRAVLAAGDLGVFQDEGPKEKTFGDYAEEYLKKAQHTLKRSTHLDYAANVRLYLAPHFGSTPLSAITRRDIKSLALKLRTNLKAKSVRKIIGTLSTILTEAVDDELITANPAFNLRKLYRSPDFADAERQSGVNPFTREELRHLLTTAFTHAVRRGDEIVFPFRAYHPFLLLLARTGMRLGEAIALKWGDVDWRGNFIIVQRSFTRGRMTSPKNGKTRRVDMSAQLREMLQRRYAERFEAVVAIDVEAQAALEIERASALEAWIFPDSTGGLMDGDNFRSRVWEPLITASKLRHHVIKDLRHTYASLLLEAGREMHYVQEQLGHHSPAFTLAIYGHLLPRNRRGDVDCLDDGAPAGTPGAPDSMNTVMQKNRKPRDSLKSRGFLKLRGEDLNLRPSGYEPDELPDCSTPLHERIDA
jgi:integrase